MVRFHPTTKSSGLSRSHVRKKQAEYIGISVEGPYKSEHYRYGCGTE